jgi:hypothetical protein
MGINSCDRPDPDDPGGLGAEESGTDRTGPTHDTLVATYEGRRLAEVGRYYDSANDPVTLAYDPPFAEKIVLKQKDRTGGDPKSHPAPTVQS